MKYKNKKSGQVLFLGIIMLLVIFFAIFFFFDMHNIIRGKLKLETAEQAASLTAARWQAKSLNLVGELNLLIATESMLNDSSQIAIPDTVEFKNERHDSEQLKLSKLYRRNSARVQALNEMQSRITFIGPLIALASAQQAAKNNGVSAVNARKDRGGSDKPSNVAEDFEEYLARIDDDNNIYSAEPNLVINGYKWREPYKLLLYEITQGGIAVRPNATITGLEGIKPSFLADLGLYPAILASAKGEPAWCQWRLRQLVKMEDSYFNGVEWYSPDFSEINFSQQSEIYPLDLRLESTMLPENEYVQFEEEANRLKQEGGYSEDVMDYTSILPVRPRFYVYNQRWNRMSETYTGPIVDTPDTPWKRGEYLSRDVADWAIYGGAVAYAECVQYIPETLPFKSIYSSSTAKKFEKGKANLKNSPSDALIRKNLNSSIQVGGNYTIDRLNTGCVAKPLGKLSGDRNPTDIPIVLPVFTRVNLIPSLMQEIRIFSYEWPLVEQFILALRTIIDDGKSIYDDDLEIPEGSEYMLEALRLLGTKEFRRQGYNPEYREEIITTRVLKKYFEKDNHLYHPTENPNGPGWLQQPVLKPCRKYHLPIEAYEEEIYCYTREKAERLNRMLDPEKETPYFIPAEGEEWYCFKGKYIKVKDGKFADIMENDPEEGCGKKVGSNPGRLPAGSNMSPERL